MGVGRGKWRPEPESNRRARICSPLRNHSAIGPPRAKWAGLAWLSTAPALVLGDASRGVPGAKRIQADPRFRASAALPGLRGDHARPAPLLPRLLVEAGLSRRSLLRALRAAVRLWRRRRGDLRPVHGRAAGVRPAARRGGLWRHIARGGAQAQIWRPARNRRDDG